jgi:protein TonB
MTAQSLILPTTDGAELRRWGFAAAFVVSAHIAAVGAYFFLAPEEDAGGADIPAVFVDMTQTPSSSPSIDDSTPGEVANDAPDTPKPTEEAKPEVADPVEKVEVPNDVTLPVPEPKAEEKKEEEQQVHQVQAAPPRSETVGPERQASAPQGSNASRDALKRWNHLVSARLQQNKRYPAAAAHGEQGTVAFTFVVDAQGKILSQRVLRSSGYPALDEEAMAMLKRAQPLPAFLPTMTQPTMEVNTSIGYTVAR